MAEVKKTNKAKMVKVYIPKIPGQKDQPDVIVGVDGRNIQIKRGVEVEIPEVYATVLQMNQRDVEKFDEIRFTS